MINLNANVGSMLPQGGAGAAGIGKSTSSGSGFSDTIKTIGEQISKVEDLQRSSDISIKDLLSGKNEDITSVVSAAAKADMSFKLLVGVRNKLIEAYKQTMNMPL